MAKRILKVSWGEDTREEVLGLIAQLAHEDLVTELKVIKQFCYAEVIVRRGADDIADELAQFETTEEPELGRLTRSFSRRMIVVNGKHRSTSSHRSANAALSQMFTFMCSDFVEYYSTLCYKHAERITISCPSATHLNAILDACDQVSGDEDYLTYRR